MSQKHILRTQILNDIRANCVTLLTDLLPLMTSIITPESEEVNEIVERTGKSKENIIDLLELKITQIIEEPTIIIKELTPNNILLISDTAVKKNKSKFPYMAKIWSGDAYDGLEEDEALNELNNELNNTVKNVTKSTIIEGAVAELS